MDAAIWGFIGTLVGALASLGGIWLTNRNTRIIHVEALKTERDEKLRVFQQSTLITLQDAVHDLLRLSGKGYYEDTIAFRQTGEWSSTPLSSDLDDRLTTARRHMLILLERVKNDELRSHVKNLNLELIKVLQAKNKETADRLWCTASLEGFETLEKIGKELRVQY